MPPANWHRVHFTDTAASLYLDPALGWLSPLDYRKWDKSWPHPSCPHLGPDEMTDGTFHLSPGLETILQPPPRVAIALTCLHCFDIQWGISEDLALPLLLLLLSAPKGLGSIFFLWAVVLIFLFNFHSSTPTIVASPGAKHSSFPRHARDKEG